MKYLRWLWLSLILGTVGTGLFMSAQLLVQAQTVTNLPERILDFSSEIEITQDTSLNITETITYQTQTDRHGIYRYLPLTLVTDSSQRGFRIEIQSVTDEQGRSYPYEKSIASDNLTLKIGDPDTTFTGEKVYVITYQVNHALNEVDNHQQLYWDITGEGWPFPIDQAKVTVTSPHADLTAARCFTGVYGSTAKDCETILTTANEALITTTQRLEPSENFTIQLDLAEPNALVIPSTLEKQGFTWWIWPLFVFIPLPLVIMVWLWWRHGRDWVSGSPHVLIEPGSYSQRLRGILERRTAPFVYEPFTDLTPAEVEAIQTENITPKSLVAEILDLARQKYLKIETTEEKKLFGKNTKYTFTKLKSSRGLNDHQAYLHESLFGTGDTVELAKLKGKFYPRVEAWKKKVWQKVTQEQYFTQAPNQARLKYFLVAILLVGLAWGAWIIIEMQLLTSLVWLLLLLIPVSLIAPLLSYFMPQKTAAGFRVQQMANGLKQTIARGKWREEIKEKHLFIEEVFPFAVSLGVVDKLAKDIDDLGEKPPEYVGGRGFTAAQLATFSHSFVTAASSNLTYNPSSSSGGSGGGGFSGGGGGGGGGGSW